MSKNTTTYLNVAISFAITLCFRLIPAPAPMTPMGMEILGILIGCIYAWCTVDLVWPSLIALTFFGLSGYTTVTNAYISAASNQTVLYMLVLLMFGGVFTSSNVAQGLAKRIISLKIADKRPWVLSLLIMLAAFVPATVVGGIPAIIIAWNLIYAISDEAGLERGAKWPAVMAFMTAVTATLGMCLFPFSLSNASMFGVLTAMDPSYVLPYGKFMVFSVVFLAVSVAAMWVVVKFVLRPDVSKLMTYNNSQTIEKFNFEQKLALGMLAAMIVLLMLPNLFSATPVGQVLNSIGNTGIVAFILAIGLLFYRDGRPVINFQKAASAGVAWNMLIMVAAVMTISGSFGSESTGIAAWIAQTISGVFAGKSAFVIAIAMIVFTLVATNFINNAVVGFVVVPLVYAFSSVIGAAGVMQIMFICLVVCQLGLLLPSGSPTGAMLYSNKEWINSKQILLYAAIMIVVMLIVSFVIGLSLTGILF